jgi:hypothetical protein
VLRYFDKPDLKDLDLPASQTNTLKTHLAFKIHDEYENRYSHGSSDGYGIIRCNEDLEDHYWRMREDIEKRLSVTTKYSYQISIQGRIDGVVVENKFGDLDSYHKFLVDKGLIDPSIKEKSAWKPGK